jgi:hypothetical protein
MRRALSGVLAVIVLCACGSSAGPVADREAELDVRAFGAVGDGKADDTAAIARAVQAAGLPEAPGKAARPTTVFFPPGVFRVTKTIELAERPGASSLRVAWIRGSGHLVPNGTAAAHTTLLWDGADGVPMLDVKGYSGLRLGDLKMDGNGKAGVLVRINSVPGIGSGQFSVERVQLDRADTGIELGASLDMCASDMTFTDLLVDNMRTAGFRAMNDQQVDYVFIRCQVSHAPTGFHFRRGGSAHFLLPTFYAVDTCFDLSGGVNNGSYSITGLFLERHSFSDPARRMVVLRARGEVNVSVRAIQTGCQYVWGEKADLATPNFILGPGAQVAVRDSILSGKTATLAGDPGGPATWLQFDNCRFTRAADPRRDVDCDAGSGFELRNCTIAVDDTRGAQYRVFRHEMVPHFARLPAQAARDAAKQ